MKFKVTITREVISKSLMCHTSHGASENCAFAVAYRQLVPDVLIGNPTIHFTLGDSDPIVIFMSDDQANFIDRFDSMDDEPQKRFSLVGESFEVEIPYQVIAYHYGDASKAAQKIIDNPIMQVI